MIFVYLLQEYIKMIVNISDSLIPYHEEDYLDDGYYDYDDIVPEKYQKLDPDIDFNNYRDKDMYYHEYRQKYYEAIMRYEREIYGFDLDITPFTI